MSNQGSETPRRPHTYNLPLADIAGPAGSVPAAADNQSHPHEDPDSYEDALEHTRQGHTLGSLLMGTSQQVEKVDVRSRVAGMLEKERDL
jgi:hypothetical protein